MIEVWKSIPSAPGYEASSLGRVRSLPGFKRKGRIKALKTKSNGYLVASIGRRRHAYVHRLVAEAFLGAVEGFVVRHLDGSRTNNILSNLAIGTAQENSDDRYRHGTVPVGESHPMRKLTSSDVVAIRASEGAQSEIAACYGVSQTCVSKIKTGKRWAHL